MNRKEICTLLNNNYDAFADFIEALSDHRFTVSPEGKWSAGQQLDHLIRSTRPVNTALSLPKLVLRLYGRPKLASRNYEGVVADYRKILARGGESVRAYIPGVVDLAQRESLLKQFRLQNARLLEFVELWDEAQLDNYQVPHPLMGKITVREMLYFTAYHASHHLHDLQTREQLRKNPWNSALEQVIF